MRSFPSGSCCAAATADDSAGRRRVTTTRASTRHAADHQAATSRNDKPCTDDHSPSGDEPPTRCRCVPRLPQSQRCERTADGSPRRAAHDDAAPNASRPVRLAVQVPASLVVTPATLRLANPYARSPVAHGRYTLIPAAAAIRSSCAYNRSPAPRADGRAAAASAAPAAVVLAGLRCVTAPAPQDAFPTRPHGRGVWPSPGQRSRVGR